VACVILKFSEKFLQEANAARISSDKSLAGDTTKIDTADRMILDKQDIDKLFA